MTRKQRKRLRKMRAYLNKPKTKRKLKVPRGYSRHHKQCRSNGGGEQDWNISILPMNVHQAWHVCFSNLRPETIAELINQKFLDPHYKFVCVAKAFP